MAITLRVLVGQRGQGAFKAWHNSCLMSHIIYREVGQGRGWTMRQPGWSVVKPTRYSMTVCDLMDEAGVWTDRAANPMYHAPGNGRRAAWRVAYRCFEPHAKAIAFLLLAALAVAGSF